MGILPNGDLIIVSLDNELKCHRIYSYPFINKPAANSTLWKHSQIYDIEIPESLKDEEVHCFVHQTKLFLIFGHQSMFQWNLSTMTFDMQYFFDYQDLPNGIVTNKNQTLLALDTSYKEVDIFSMETGIRISRYG